MLRKKDIWEKNEWKDVAHCKNAKVIHYLKPHEYILVYLNNDGNLASFKISEYDNEKAKNRIIKFAQQQYPCTIKIIGVNN